LPRWNSKRSKRTNEKGADFPAPFSVSSHLAFDNDDLQALIDVQE
jgi:hypothetical protein